MSAWISTKDRLPDTEGEYLTASMFYDRYVAYAVISFEKIGKTMAFCDYDENLDRYATEVDAWMPIEPYKGMEDKTE